MRSFKAILAVAALLLLASTPSFAQDGKPRPIFEGVAGYTGFADDSLIGHTTVGAGARVFVTHRLAIGPEILYMAGPAPDKDIVATANFTFDLRRERHEGTVRAVVPYVAGSAGLMRHWGDYLPPGQSSVSGRFFSWGGGARIRAGGRFYVAPEFRFGIEPHLRFTVSAGVR